MRWFNRGNLAAGASSGSVDVPLEGLVAAVLRRRAPSSVPVAEPRTYELGALEGV